MSTARKILSNTFAQLLGKAIISLLGLAVVKISTSYLSVSGYGEYIAIYEFLAFFGIAADLGLFTIAVKEMSENEENVAKIIGNILSLRTILVLVTMVFAIITIFLIPRYADTRIPIGVAIASFTVIFSILNGTLTSVLQTRLKMEIASIASVLGKAVSVIFMLYIIFYGFPVASDAGFYMLIVAGVLGNLAMLLTTNHFVRKLTPLKYQFDFGFWKTILKKSLPYGLALILNTIYFRIDSLLILFIRGPEEVGIYGVAMKMLEHFTIIPLYFMNSVLPILTKAIKEGQEKYKTIIKYAFDFLAVISIPMVIGGTILAFPIIFIVSTPAFLSRLSEGFFGSDIAFQILVFALMFQFLNVLFAFILIALNQQTKLLYINGACVILNIVTNFIFIPTYGFRGAALTSVVSEFFILIWTYFLARKYLDFQLDFFTFFKILFSALMMGLLIKFLQPLSYNFIQNWNVLVLIPFGAAIYTALLFLTKAVDKNLLKLILKRK